MKSSIRYSIRLMLMIIIIFVSMSTSSFSYNDDKIKIGYFPNYGTIIDENSDSSIGYGYDMFMEIARHTWWEYEFIPMDWEEGMSKLSSGEIDIFGPMQKNDERTEKYDFTTLPFGNEYGLLYALEDSLIYYDDFEAFDSLIIGASPDCFFLEDFLVYSEKTGFTPNIIFTNSTDIYGDMEKGLYDLYLSGSMLSIPSTKAVAKISSHPFYYAVSKESTGILEQLNTTLERLQQDNLGIQSYLQEKYNVNMPVSVPVFTKSEMEAFENYPEFLVKVESDVIPLQYFDNTTGNAGGICVDILNEIAESCGVSFRYFSGEAPINSDLPILIASYGEYPTRIKNYSKPYFGAPLVFVGPSGLNFGQGHTVAVPMLDMLKPEKLAEMYPQFKFIPHKSLDNVISALKEGSVDMAITTLYSFDEIVRKSNHRNYVAIPVGIDYNYHIRTDSSLDPNILSGFDKAILRIPQNVKDTIVFSNTIKYHQSLTNSDFFSQNIGIISILTVVLAGMLLVLISFNLFTIKNKKALIQKAAYVDPITGLPTMLKFKMEAENLLSKAEPNQYIMISADIQKFRYINNLFAYEAGNEVLKLLGNKIKDTMSPGSILTRADADNFILIVPKFDYNTIWADRYGLPQGVMELLGRNYPLAFSVGVYIISDPSDNLSSMIDRANYARKITKKRHSNGVELYTDSMEKDLKNQRDVTVNMEYALESHQFIPYLQPKLSLSSGEVVGAEILARWLKPDGTILPPSDFIPVFEQNGFILRLDLYMFEQLCSLKRDWADNAELSVLPISVNLSRVTLLSEGICEKLISIVNMYGVSTRYIELEITESVLAIHSEQVIDTVNKLQGAGFSVSLDDFGSEYSAYTLLPKLMLDVLKVDRGFLSTPNFDSRDLDVLRSIITMAKSLGMQTVCEGVETAEQAELLRKLGCDIGQGYYFSRPVDIDRFIIYLVKSNNDDLALI